MNLLEFFRGWDLMRALKKFLTEEEMQSVEKRWSPRNQFYRKVEVVPHNGPLKGLTYSTAPESCWSKDISKGGISLETKKAYRTQSVLKLTFQYMEKKAMNVVAKVIWSKQDRCGLKFMAFGEDYRR